MYISSSFFYRSQIWFANPTAVSVYIGTERSGVMRQFPYAHQGTGLAKTRYKASALPPFSTAGGEEYYGYDPRKRPWYAEAKHNKKLIITAPYVYSTAPYPVGITVAMPILHPVTGELYGVIGFDVTVSLLEKVILSSSILCTLKIAKLKFSKLCTILVVILVKIIFIGSFFF